MASRLKINMINTICDPKDPFLKGRILLALLLRKKKFDHESTQKWKNGLVGDPEIQRQ